MTEITQVNERMTQRVARMGEIAAQVEHDVNAAVTALRFQDIAAQLLDQLCRRVEALGMMTDALARLGGQAASACAMGRGSPMLGEELDRCALAVEEARGHAAYTPISRSGMSTGRIESF